MEAPALQVTPTAIDALRRQMASLPDIEPVVVLAWVLGSSVGRLDSNGDEHIDVRGPHWGIGYHSRAKLPPDEIVVISGIPFTFAVSPNMMGRLDGATLDLIDGRFEVTKRAI